MPVRVGQFVVGQSSVTTQGDGRSWDLSFVKATRWITQPVGWWGGDWGAARPGRRRRLDYAGWSINNIRIHAGLICESCLYDVSFTDLQATTRQETTSIHPLSCRRTPQKETLRVTSPCHLHVVGNKRTDDGLVGHTLHPTPGLRLGTPHPEREVRPGGRRDQGCLVSPVLHEPSWRGVASTIEQ